MRRVMHGVVHGNRVVVTEPLDMADGQEVEVVVNDSQDHLTMEVSLIRQQPELMELLSRHSNAGPKSSLEQVRKSLGLTKEAGSSS